MVRTGAVRAGGGAGSAAGSAGGKGTGEATESRTLAVSGGGNVPARAAGVRASRASRSFMGAGAAARDASRFPTNTPSAKAAPRKRTAAKAMARTCRFSSDSSIFSRNRCSSRIPGQLSPVRGGSENPEAPPYPLSDSPGGSSIRSGAVTPRIPSRALCKVCASAQTR